MKTNDTYMKFSWLTVTGASMDKDHKCIVNHESDIGGVNQEILFPPVNKGLMAVMGSKVDSEGHSETKQNTEVVTASPLNSRSFSPVPRAVEMAIVFLLVTSRMTALNFLSAKDLRLVGSFLRLSLRGTLDLGRVISFAPSLGTHLISKRGYSICQKYLKLKLCTQRERSTLRLMCSDRLDQPDVISRKSKSLRK